MAAFYDLGITDEWGLMFREQERPEVILQTRLRELIPSEQWRVFRRAIHAARSHGVDFAFGGAFAVATYTGKWRDTKDMDLYILPEERETIKSALTEAGLSDYYPIKDYDRSWIYRAHDGDVIVDAIWAMANHRAEVDRDWLARGPLVTFDDEAIHVVPPEELIWSKLYVLQKDRCDWPDVLNIVHALGPELDWRRLLQRVGPDDARLLDGLLSVFRWLTPERAKELPSWLWQAHGKSRTSEEETANHVRLLDSRPWFRPMEKSE